MTRPESLQELAMSSAGKTVAGPVFAIDLFTGKPFTSIPEAVLACYETFLELCPPERLRFYATETMDQHRAVSASTFKLLPSWLKKGARARKYLFLELMSGDDREAIPDFRLFVGGYEPGSIGYSDRSANQIRLCVPAIWGADRPRELRDMVKRLASLVPLVAGHAGYAMDSSRYFDRIAFPHACQTVIRHPGLDLQIGSGARERAMVGHDGMKTTSWLTLVGKPLLPRLGGVEQLRRKASAALAVETTSSGLILEAGEAPQLGDMQRGDRLPSYAEAFRLVAPVAEASIARAKGLMRLPGGASRPVRAWLRRFADEA